MGENDHFDDGLLSIDEELFALDEESLAIGENFPATEKPAGSAFNPIAGELANIGYSQQTWDATIA